MGHFLYLMELNYHEKHDFHIDQIRYLIKERIELTDVFGISTLTGIIGDLIFISELDRICGTNGADTHDILDRVIRQVVKQIETEEQSSTFVDGLAGFGWGISFLSQTRKEFIEENSFLESLDLFISSHIELKLKSRNYDYFYGVLGYFKYLLQRSKVNIELRPKLEGFMKSFITQGSDWLEGKVWQKPFEINQKSIDLSMSHGQASVMSLMCESYRQGILVDETSKILDGFCRSIKTLVEKSSRENRVPDHIENEELFYAPLRWCHGDLGIAHVLMDSGVILKNDLYIEIGYEVSQRLAQFKGAKEQELVSATICHGTLGVAHMFLKLGMKMDNDVVLLNASEYWFGESLNIIQSTIGYKYYDDDAVYREKEGILFGLGGIGLAILSRKYPLKSNWDQSILL
ncbi:MAG TPA: hypothetical protein DDX92_07890 [Flavobacteriales bacterium]|jgi:hypothetical protein|nr:hypothetical protein [Flavobacteriales bacterium]